MKRRFALTAELLFNISVTSVFMFTGKGGVGKTTCSAATALCHANRGARTLALSTDATPSLAHIFEISFSHKPAEVLPRLFIQEVGEREIRAMWEGKFGREVHEVFSAFVDIDYADFSEFMTSVLPGLGEEFMVDYIRETAQKDFYDYVVWDTAPLGQTLSLLETPALLGRHLKLAPRIYSKLKLGKRSREPVLDILKRWEALSAANMEFLRNEVGFTIVVIPEALAVEQLESTFIELSKYGFKPGRIIVNYVVKTEDSDFLRTKSRQQRPYLARIHEKYANLEIIELPMFPREVKGLERLNEVSRIILP